MPDFAFNSKESPEQNIASFFAHLATYDKEMAAVLSNNLPLIHPLPEYPPQRTAARKNFSGKVLSALAALEKVEEAAKS